MSEITIRANAKINLFLEVTGKLENGYHTISTVMQSVGLSDFITVRENSSKEIRIISDSEKMPTDSTNIAFRTAKAFFDKGNIQERGIDINIEKNIPMEAGLAGGSADGAAVLLALNQIYDNLFSTHELCEIGALIGADIPFCITKSAMLAEGIGDILSPCYPLPDCNIVIAKCVEGVSTKWAYAEIDKIPNRVIRENNMPLLLESRDLHAICRGMYNCFEQLVPAILPIKDIMYASGCIGCMMSGSGTSVFGIFDNGEKAKKAKNTFTELGISAYICAP